MAQAFVIMQIGNPELDKIYNSFIAPSLEACGLEPKRVDKHNKGGLLKSEIISFLEESEIIIADVTNERPNCYLEIGYAMGIDKFKNLILTACEDHFPESPNFIKEGPKIHFDLAGYDILAWHRDKMHEFRTELEKRIRRRLLIVTPSLKSTELVIWDNQWLEKHREKAEEGLKKHNLSGLMEIRFSMVSPKLNKSQSILNEAARSSQIHTFGWPIGVYLGNTPQKPHPTAEGVVAEIFTESYDYWTIKKSGDFYSLISLFEDTKGPFKSNNIFFDTRIIRITEAILFCAKLYSYLGVDRTKTIYFAIRHAGLIGREITAANLRRDLLRPYEKSIEDEVETIVIFTLQQVETNLVSIVKELTKPLFVLFGFFELSDSVYEDIVEKFTRGQI